jgi:hypothetical protein
MKDEIHRDRFVVPESVREMPKGKVRVINGVRYYWNGSKFQPLPEKQDNPGREPEAKCHSTMY